ncbi:MAG TPA: RecX family transcriptional regulator [Anaerolineales bacterium]
MKKITAIEAQKKRSNRVNIYLDGEFAFGLARITAAWLRMGQELDEKKIEQLQIEDARERALQQALLFLGYRARSESEIRKNLNKHEIPEAIIEETIERLRRDGLANDDQFARAWVENRIAFRPRSRRMMELELRQKGLDDETAKAALEDVDDEALAYEAAKKRAPRFKDLEWSEFRTKLSGFLTRRGFPYPVIIPVVARIWNKTHSEEQQFEEEDFT